MSASFHYKSYIDQSLARLKAEGLDLDRMSEDEVMDYVDRVIHEHRQEQREKQRAGALQST